MRLLPLADAPDRGLLLDCRVRDWMPLLVVTVFFAGLAAFIAVPKGPGALPALAIVPGLAALTVGAFLAQRLRAARRPGAWRLRATEHGLYVNLVSHRAPAPGPGQPAIAFLPAGDIAAVRLLHETLVVPHRRSDYALRAAYIELHLASPLLEPVHRLLYDERRRHARAGAAPEAPASVPEPQVLRIAWEWVRPAERAAAAALAAHYPRLPDAAIECNGRKLDAAGAETLAAALWERGQVEDVLHLLRALHRLPPRGAREYAQQHFEFAPFRPTPDAARPLPPAQKRRLERPASGAPGQ